MNAELQQSPSTHQIWHHWRNNALQQPEGIAVVYYRLQKPPHYLTWGDLWLTARKFAEALSEAGVCPGDVCATIIHQGENFHALYFGITLTGAIPTVLAYPNPRLHPDKFKDGLRGMLQHSGFDWVLTERPLLDAITTLSEPATGSFKGTILPFELPLPATGEYEPEEMAPEAPCLLQHSSGTTGLQKPVMLSHRAVLDHLDRLAAAVALDNRDKIVSWLPLYHDMGLIAAFHLPLRFGIPVIQLDPFEWVSAPISMLSATSEHQATIAWLPNFAYNLMVASASADDMAGLSLSSIRLLINCSEPVSAQSHELFRACFETYGFRPSSLGASYAMAEATFAVTQTRPGECSRVLKADITELMQGRYIPAESGAASRDCASSGTPLSGCRLRIVDSGGTELSQGQTGEIEVSSPTLFSGYRNRAAETAEVMKDGWYRTGDIGFLWADEIFVVGRHKDIIIIAGKTCTRRTSRAWWKPYLVSLQAAWPHSPLPMTVLAPKRFASWPKQTSRTLTNERRPACIF